MNIFIIYGNNIENLRNNKEKAVQEYKKDIYGLNSHYDNLRDKRNIDMNSSVVRNAILKLEKNKKPPMNNNSNYFLKYNCGMNFFSTLDAITPKISPNFLKLNKFESKSLKKHREKIRFLKFQLEKYIENNYSFFDHVMSNIFETNLTKLKRVFSSFIPDLDIDKMNLIDKQNEIITIITSNSENNNFLNSMLFFKKLKSRN